MSTQLPGGGKPWFIRRRTGNAYSINPYSKEGWLVTLGYVLVILADTLLLLPKPTTVGVVAYLAVFAVATVLFLVILFRMSPPEWRKD